MEPKSEKLNNWYKFLINCKDKKFLEENEIVRCNAIGCINGLTNVVMDGDRILGWEGGYCKVCKGYGFIFEEDKLYTVKTCPMCEGKGCDDCENQGVVDWVTYIQIRAKTRSL